MVQTSLYAGVELGGAKCVCVLADGEGRIVEQSRIDTTTPEVTLSAVEAVLTGWIAGGSVVGLGVASFGPVDLKPGSPTWGFITSTPKPGWRGVDVAGRLGRALNLTVTFDTDVNGAAAAEGRWGAAQGLADYAYVTVGTGVGVGLIVNGRPTRGLGHCEFGHARVPRLPGDVWPGACAFHGDCVEGLCCGPSVQARRRDGAIPADGDEWAPVVHALAGMAHDLVLATGPEAILMGGGIITCEPNLIGRIDAALRISLADYVVAPPGLVRPAALGALAGPLGPIALVVRSAEGQRW